MTRQSAIQQTTVYGVGCKVERWMRSAGARPPRNKEWEAGIGRHILPRRIGGRRSSINDLSLIYEHGRWQRSHGESRQRHERGNRRSRFDLTVRQRPGPIYRYSLREFRAALKHVVGSPHGPHARGKMRIEVAME